MAESLAGPIALAPFPVHPALRFAFSASRSVREPEERENRQTHRQLPGTRVGCPLSGLPRVFQWCTVLRIPRCAGGPLALRPAWAERRLLQGPHPICRRVCTLA